jgi:hypothetical protein
MKKLSLIFILLTIFGCSDPKKTVIPKNIEDISEIKPSVDKLTDEEKQLLMGYLFRAKSKEIIMNEEMKENVTIGEAIQDQKIWKQELEIKQEIEKQMRIQEEEAKRKRQQEEKEIQEKLKEELKNKIIKMQNTVSVGLVNKILVEADIRKGQFQDMQYFKFGIKNKSDKDIEGVKGILALNDLFEKEVDSFEIKFDDGVKAGESAFWIESRRYNQFMENHRAVAALDNEKYSTSFIPTTIIFKDGSTIQVEDGFEKYFKSE